MQNRIGSCKRKTKETDIELTINLDGQGKNPVSYTHLDVYKRQLMQNMNITC